MAGGDTFQFAVQSLVDVTYEVLERAEITMDDIDVFAYHQANGRILRAVGERLKLPSEKVLSTVAWTGNTSAASLPIALDDALRNDRLKPGDRVLMAAIGGGAIWGACLIEWRAERSCAGPSERKETYLGKHSHAGRDRGARRGGSRGSEVDRDAIHRDAQLETLDVDSLDVVELAEILRAEMNIDIEARDFTDVRTFGDVMDVIVDRAKAT